MFHLPATIAALGLECADVLPVGTALRPSRFQTHRRCDGARGAPLVEVTRSCPAPVRHHQSRHASRLVLRWVEGSGSGRGMVHGDPPEAAAAREDQHRSSCKLGLAPPGRETPLVRRCRLCRSQAPAETPRHAPRRCPTEPRRATTHGSDSHHPAFSIDQGRSAPIGVSPRRRRRERCAAGKPKHSGSG